MKVICNKKDFCDEAPLNASRLKQLYHVHYVAKKKQVLCVLSALSNRLSVNFNIIR